MDLLKRIAWGCLPMVLAAAVYFNVKAEDPPQAREHQAAASIALEPAPIPEAVTLALEEINSRIETNDDGARVRHEMALAVYSRSVEGVRSEVDQLRTELEKLREEVGKFRALAASQPKAGKWAVRVVKASSGPEMRGGLK